MSKDERRKRRRRKKDDSKPKEKYRFGKWADLTDKERNLIYAVVFLYFLAFLLWLFIAYKVHDRNLFAVLILLIPLLVMGISLWNLMYIPARMEEQLFRANYISICVLICVPLLSWVNRDISPDRKHKFIWCVILAVIFAIISLYDVWTDSDWQFFTIHFKSIAETFAITLLLYALYSYYIESGSNILTH